MGVGTVSNGVVAEGTAHEATAAAVFMMTVMAVAAVVSTNVAEWVRVGERFDEKIRRDSMARSSSTKQACSVNSRLLNYGLDRNRL